jgi:LPXTG-site transpeptidase (sortase) family protein
MKKVLRFVKGHRLASLVAVVVVAAGVVTAVSLRRPKPPEKPKDNTVTYSTDHPDEKPPAKDYQWQGRPEEPKYIDLPSISGGGYIQKVGVDQHKAVAVPNNIHMAGWFNQTAIPGEPGYSVIDGHVNGRVSNDGIFKDLTKVKVGDNFTIEFGNGTKKNFKVIKSVTVDTDQAGASLFTVEPGVTKQVNLITCSGTWDKNTKEYNKRTIVMGEFD